MRLMRSLKHPNVVQLVDAFEWRGEYYMIMELCQNNSLKGKAEPTLEFLRSRVRVTEMEAKYYLMQLVAGLEYLHGEGVVHRDIKLGNIFLNYHMEIKIGDFGLSTRVKSARERRFTTCGTPNYIAPEILTETGHSFEVIVTPSRLTSGQWASCSTPCSWAVPPSSQRQWTTLTAESAAISMTSQSKCQSQLRPRASSGSCWTPTRAAGRRCSRCGAATSSSTRRSRPACQPTPFPCRPRAAS
jgi:serine/threonine protein kinase